MDTVIGPGHGHGAQLGQSESLPVSSSLSPFSFLNNWRVGLEASFHCEVRRVSVKKRLQPCERSQLEGTPGDQKQRPDGSQFSVSIVSSSSLPVLFKDWFCEETNLTFCLANLKLSFCHLSFEKL